MSHLLAILFVCSGFALIALSMGRHQATLVGRRLGPVASQRARLSGYALLAVALIFDLTAFRTAHGAIAWFGHLSIGAWGVVTWLCVRARRRKSSASAIKSSVAFRGEN